MLVGRLRDVVRGGALLLLIAAAVLLSFSRGAWGQFVFTAMVLMCLMFITSALHQRAAAHRASWRSRRRRAGAVHRGAACRSARVADLFRQRAALEQDYDVGQLGRFGRHVLGALLALDKPFGIGPLQFSHYFPEDTHNSYLNAFMSGGWLERLPSTRASRR